MNIFKRISNWIIKKLGGYTANIVESKNEAIRYYYGLYKTEHENYLAMLNCRNATAAAAQQNTAGVAGAIDTIKAYCKSKDSCDECALYNKNSGCKIHEIPCCWEVPE